jgi:hypothetical protein
VQEAVGDGWRCVLSTARLTSLHTSIPARRHRSRDAGQRSYSYLIRDVSHYLQRSTSQIRRTPSGVTGFALTFADTGLNVRVIADHVSDAAFLLNRPCAIVLPHPIATNLELSC